MITPSHWLSYWKKSLLDSLKAEINPDTYQETIQLPSFRISSDKIPFLAEVNKLIDTREKQINQAQHIKSADDPHWIHLNDIQVLIAPFRLNPLPERQTCIKQHKTIYPFWYAAKLNREGTLSAPFDINPFIPRSYLLPVVDDRIEYTIGATETVDRACATGDHRFKTYEEYIQHVLHFFREVAETELHDYRHGDFVTDPTACLLAPNNTIGAAFNLIGLYEQLLKLKPSDLPPVLKRLATLDAAEPKQPMEPADWMLVNQLHSGQMKAPHPLSYSQRKSLYTLLGHPEETIFAVNGPPGSGKTTLLQSIVANAMVESVGKEAPQILLACSANNQAVTNIIESFTKKDDEPEIRWLPDMNGYATYLPSAGKKSDTLGNINYMKPSGEGLFVRLETLEYVEQAQAEYLKQAEAYFKTPLFSVKEVIKRLQEQIESSRKILKDAEKIWKNYLENREKFKQEYLTYKELSGSYVTPDGLFSIEWIDCDKKLLEELDNQVIGYFRHEPFFRKIGCWLKIAPALNNRQVELNNLFRHAKVAPGAFPENIPDASVSSKRINDWIKRGEEISQAISQWHAWQESLEKKWPASVEKKIDFFRHNPSEEGTAFYDALDTTLRYQAFVDAVRYWEGRWIEETKAFLALPPSKQRRCGEKTVKKRWYQRAMLTPCFVSTFYMVPKFFNYSKRLEEKNGNSVFSYLSLTDFIDYLIVDEAGQVPPEVGAGVFALARRAVVVGDVKQIEPVWNILPKVDLGNLKSEGLIGEDEKAAEEIYRPKGFLASCGSIMQMAQNACGFTERDSTERGVMLTEHFRCYNEIIAYCNELAYHGVLQPRRGLSSRVTDNLYPPMVCIHVEGKSSVRNKDRFNEAECNAICNWLAEQKEVIEKRYIDKKKYHCLEDIVGILTPFVGQKKCLGRILRQGRFKVDRMKLGTVHALQGAERPIVLFSAVYGPDDVGTMFFDMGNKPNMLNVAVSRAQDSFIVFANSKIFCPATNSPSGILARYLKFNK